MTLNFQGFIFAGDRLSQFDRDKVVALIPLQEDISPLVATPSSPSLNKHRERANRLARFLSTTRTLARESI